MNSTLTFPTFNLNSACVRCTCPSREACRLRRFLWFSYFLILTFDSSTLCLLSSYARLYVSVCMCSPALRIPATSYLRQRPLELDSPTLSHDGYFAGFFCVREGGIVTGRQPVVSRTLTAHARAYFEFALQLTLPFIYFQHSFLVVRCFTFGKT